MLLKWLKKNGISIDDAESYWSKAKLAAKKYEGKPSYYAVVTSIFKKMLHLELTWLDIAYINEVEGFEQYRAEIAVSFFGNS